MQMKADQPPEKSQSLNSGGDGSSMERAVVINAENSPAGIRAEYEYIARLYGRRNIDWRLIRQFIINCEGRYYDVLRICLSNGEEKPVWFDINSFFGK